MQVPLDSWQIGPHNRWAYQHVDELVPTVVVSRGDGPVRELPSRPARLDVEDPPYLDGLAVLRDGDARRGALPQRDGRDDAAPLAVRRQVRARAASC